MLTRPDQDESFPPCIYLCGNSLGLQPRNTRKYIDHYLRTWATKGVTGHFIPHNDQLLPPFVDVDEAGSKLMAPVVGALQSEVAVMGSLTANIHILLGSFYRPNQERYKIIMEGKAFPSDHVSGGGDILIVFWPKLGLTSTRLAVCHRVSGSASRFQHGRRHGPDRAREPGISNSEHGTDSTSD